MLNVNSHLDVFLYVFFRAEPLLARIKADRTVVVSPVFDKVHYDDLHVERYISSAHGFDWATWCLYESFNKEWSQTLDESQPGKYVVQKVCAISHKVLV